MAASSGHSSDLGFGGTLERLKRRGSNILIVGPPSTQLRQAASRRLLGDATTEPRRRLFVFTGGNATHERLGNGPLSPETVRVISQRPGDRVTSVTTTLADEDIPHESVDPGKLSALAWAVADEIQTFSRLGGGLSPGELRVCVDSLGPVYTHHDDREVRRFLSTLTNRIRSTGGMAHYHLPAARDDPVVADLERMFDAVVELRQSGGAPEQRWNVPDFDVDSGWLPL